MRAIWLLLIGSFLWAGSDIVVAGEENKAQSRLNFKSGSASYEQHKFQNKRDSKFRQKPTKTAQKHPPQITPNVQISTPNGSFNQQTQFVSQGRNLRVVEQTSFSQGLSTISITQTSNYKRPVKRKTRRNRR